jgi:membrane fusion protein, multidrug efflux system
MTEPTSRPSRRKWLTIPVVAAIVAGNIWALTGHPVAQQSPAPPAGTSPAAPPAVPVSVATATRQDVPVYLHGLGAVQAYGSVLLRARVDGTIDRIVFTEGQDVQPGDLLAQIDPRPYQAALDQAVAKKASDAALLVAATADVQRYTQLVRTEVASQQKLESTRALAGQLAATILGDDAAIVTAKLNLDYTRITAPIAGRVGLRLVDQGNFVRQAEAQGIVTIAQIRPISLVFTLPQDALPRIAEAMAHGKMSVLAYASDDKTLLDEGTLLTPDNAIDPTTGTIKLKATFPNGLGKLWPGQFVNARLLIETRRNVITVPSAAVQRGSDGLYVYMVKPDAKVARQEVTVEIDNGRLAIVSSGVQEGDQVVTGGHSRLQPGSPVTVGGAAQAGSIGSGGIGSGDANPGRRGG